MTKCFDCLDMTSYSQIIHFIALKATVIINIKHQNSGEEDF
jgi:hypothetical protein